MEQEYDKQDFINANIYHDTEEKEPFLHSNSNLREHQKTRPERNTLS